MDRTKASDAFNAGSIPVGCTVHHLVFFRNFCRVRLWKEGLGMQRNKKKSVRDYIVKNSKFVFPIIVIIVVAVTVSIALNASNAMAEPSDQEGGEPRVANVEPSESE